MFDLQLFEAAARENGIRYWSAHDFMETLGYENWLSFRSVLQRAQTSCLQLGIDADEVFIPYDLDGVKSYKLTRFACFLVAMQADASKPQVAKAQVALAAIAEALVEEKIALSGLERIEERKKLTMAEKVLGASAQTAGLEGQSYAIFKDAGFRGMYNRSLRQLIEYKGAPQGKTLYDYMGLTELAANTFRATQTAERMKRNNVRGLEQAKTTAHEVGKEVRDVMLKSSGVAPENLRIERPVNDVKKQIRAANKEMKKLDSSVTPKKKKKATDAED